MNARIAELHSKVFSTPRNSPEREQAYSELSESDRRAVFNLERVYAWAYHKKGYCGNETGGERNYDLCTIQENNG